MSSIAYPFLRAPEAAVLAAPWDIVLDGELQTSRGHLPHWDYASRLNVRRELSLDIDRLAAALGLPREQLQLGCMVTAGTAGARISRSRMPIWQSRLTADQPSVVIEAELASERLSGTLTLVTDLVLVGPTSAGSALSPKKVGARLWQDLLALAIEPQAPRFPMEVISFGRMLTRVPADALWFVDWRVGDLASEFTTAVRLYINEDQPLFLQRINEADEAVIRLLMQGVALQLVRAALDDAEFANRHEDPPTSVGGVIRSWIARCFPTMSVPAVSALARNDPGRFASALGSAAMMGASSGD